jgi:hypothetical protein
VPAGIAHAPSDGMNTNKIEESSRMLAATSWSAIATGVFVALALQVLLLMLGLAFGVSVGDRRIDTGFAWWSFLVTIVSLVVGGAVTARLSRTYSTLGGMVAGAMTWAVAIVVGGMFGNIVGETLATRVSTSGVWAAFLGILLGLAAAMLGGVLGATRGLGSRPSGTDLPVTPIETPAHVGV